MPGNGIKADRPIHYATGAGRASLAMTGVRQIAAQFC